MTRFLPALLLLIAGCGGNLHPVNGRVHYADGEPVTHGRVILETPGPTGIWGLVRPDGTFTLGTNTPDDGVPAGTYNVYLENTDTFPPAGSTENFTPQPLVHSKYGDPKTSGLTLEVPVKVQPDLTVERP